MESQQSQRKPGRPRKLVRVGNKGGRPRKHPIIILEDDPRMETRSGPENYVSYACHQCKRLHSVHKETLDGGLICSSALCATFFCADHLTEVYKTTQAECPPDWICPRCTGNCPCCECENPPKRPRNAIDEEEAVQEEVTIDGSAPKESDGQGQRESVLHDNHFDSNSVAKLKIEQVAMYKARPEETIPQLCSPGFWLESEKFRSYTLSLFSNNIHPNDYTIQFQNPNTGEITSHGYIRFNEVQTIDSEKGVYRFMLRVSLVDDERVLILLEIKEYSQAREFHELLTDIYNTDDASMEREEVEVEDDEEEVKVGKDDDIEQQISLDMSKMLRKYVDALTSLKDMKIYQPEKDKIRLNQNLLELRTRDGKVEEIEAKFKVLQNKSEKKISRLREESAAKTLEIERLKKVVQKLNETLEDIGKLALGGAIEGAINYTRCSHSNRSTEDPGPHAGDHRSKHEARSVKDGDSEFPNTKENVNPQEEEEGVDYAATASNVNAEEVEKAASGAEEVEKAASGTKINLNVEDITDNGHPRSVQEMEEIEQPKKSANKRKKTTRGETKGDVRKTRQRLAAQIGKSRAQIQEKGKSRRQKVGPAVPLCDKRNESMKTSTLLNTLLVKQAAQIDQEESRRELKAAQERFVNAERCVKVLDLVERKLKDNILGSKAEKTGE